MSKFLSENLINMKPYKPGEQPRSNEQWIKLNTNESPFPPSANVEKLIRSYDAEKLRLYPDPSCDSLITKLSEEFDVDKCQVMLGNGSDEILAFSFMGLCNNGVAFSDLSYGFYPVFSDVFNKKAKIVELNQSFEIDINDYEGLKQTIVIANPNAPTGLELSQKDIVKLLENDKERLVIIDEAYVDFGAESSVKLVKKYDNLLVIGTFSKSRNLAGARIGYAIANEEIISDLNAIKFSFNPYNLNRLSIDIGTTAMNDKEYFESCIKQIKLNREYLTKKLKDFGFEVLESKANFIFVKNSNIIGKEYYKRLKEKGILVRYFDLPRTKEYVRITIGNIKECDALLKMTKEVLSEV
ncbi:MAG: histidinol-phosphate transaminase [Peptostreptococcaceae bacterium]|nr:histidinol-phosphate transaminase [Peptostreptococcaceae bacterium]